MGMGGSIKTGLEDWGAKLKSGPYFAETASSVAETAMEDKTKGKKSKAESRNGERDDARMS